MSVVFNAKKRQSGNASEDRISKVIPAVVYGPGFQPISVGVEYNPFEKLYNSVGGAELIDLVIEGEKEPVKVLIQAVQFDPIHSTITHIDFRGIDPSKEMVVKIHLRFVGESAAVKEMGGTFVKLADAVEAKCLPKDLVGEIQVDISSLKTFEDALRISDLVLPGGIKPVGNPSQIIAKVTPPLTEEQLKAMEEAGTKGVADIEVVKKEKKVEEGAVAEDAEAADKKDAKK
ncbi:MAG TPA: 50S ribosomal protein L25 [Candidatus Magasanikbacteria bacterium]|nr:50S ribosomal protein L25 [Candidatus Magasanikbacteria bacterium]